MLVSDDKRIVYRCAHQKHMILNYNNKTQSRVQMTPNT